MLDDLGQPVVDTVEQPVKMSQGSTDIEVGKGQSLCPRGDKAALSRSGSSVTKQPSYVACLVQECCEGRGR